LRWYPKRHRSSVDLLLCISGRRQFHHTRRTAIVPRLSPLPGCRVRLRLSEVY